MLSYQSSLTLLLLLFTHLFFVLCAMSLDVMLTLFALFSSFLVGLKTVLFFFLLFLFFIVVFVVKEITIFWFWRWQVECICFSFTNVCIDAFVISEL